MAGLGAAAELERRQRTPRRHLQARDRYIRRLLVIGAQAVIRYARGKGAVGAPWITSLLGRRPTLVAAVALANKTARIAWAILARGEAIGRPRSSRHSNLGAGADRQTLRG